VLQDALNAIGYRTGGLDGNFGPGTRSAVIRFQTREGLGVTGVVNCATWQRLTTRAIGIGRTATVIDY
jgi:peptidoglycan hydrolase-like protein with peptidoglycan-binding domain